MDRATALAKIHKCLALSKSANAHEAAAALRQAQKLMEAHAVDEQDLQLADVNEHIAPAASVVITRWDAALTNLVATTFGCEVISSTRRVIGRTCTIKRERRVRFIGVGAAAEVAGYSYEVLLRQVIRDRRAHMAAQPKACKPATRTARGDAFARAWVAGVAELVERFAGTEANRALLDAYVRRHHPDLVDVKPKDRSVGRNVRDASYTAGLTAGRRARLERGLDGAQAPTLIPA